MKTLLLTLVLLTFGAVSVTEAQLRDDLPRSGDLTGTIYETTGSTSHSIGDLFNSLNMEMGHSYSMSIGSVGGQYHSVNAYTNHMAFGLTDNLTGNLDVSFLHSPFGSSFSGMGMGGGNLGSRVVIDRAQLDYQISPNTHLSVQFSQRPYSSSYFGGSAGVFGRRSNFWY